MCPSCGLVYDGKNANKQANGRYLSRGNYYHFLLLGESQANLFERAPKNGCSANALTGMPWKKVTPPWKKATPPWTLFPTASISGGAAERENGVLRKKCHVVRKKNHVVRKLFYVASIFHGIRPPANSPPHRATKGGVGVKGSGCGAQGSRLGVGRQKVRRNMPRMPHVCVPG